MRQLAERLASVRDVIYLVFNEGYSATAGDDLMRPHLCEDALRLGRMLVELAHDDAEAHGLLALLGPQAVARVDGSRRGRRSGAGDGPGSLSVGPGGRLIEHGLAELLRAESLANLRARYTLQAAIAAYHARARSPGETDWARIASLYGELDAIAQKSPYRPTQSRRGHFDGRGTGGRIGAPRCAGRRAFASKLPSAAERARAPCSRKSADSPEARAEFERAASMTENVRQKNRLLERARACFTTGLV